MRVVVAMPQVPRPEGGAADRCSLGLLAGLRGHGLDVTAIAALQSFDVGGALPADVDVVEVPDDEPGWRARLANVRRPIGSLERGPFATRLREAAARADVVHLEQIEVAGCATGSTPAAIHLHYRILLDRSLGLPLDREHRRTLEFVRAERRALRHADWLIATSPRVADTLRRDAPRAEIVVASLTLDPAGYAPAPPPARPTAGIIGTAAWPPTARAIQRLASEVWPRVAAAVPEAELRIAGRGTDVLPVSAHLPERATVVGSVRSAVDFLAGLSLLVYPVDRGSGMKVKVLEAIALGVPVVTTRDGAEGVAPNDGVVVVGSADGAAEATASILRDPLERAERARAARCCFVEHHSPAPATEPLVGLYQRMAKSR